MGEILVLAASFDRSSYYTGKSVPTNRRSICQYCFRSWFIYLLGGNHKYEEGNVQEYFHFHKAIKYIKYNLRCRLSKIFSIFPRKMLGFVSFVGKMLAFTYLLCILCNECQVHLCQCQTVGKYAKNELEIFRVKLGNRKSVQYIWSKDMACPISYHTY